MEKTPLFVDDGQSRLVSSRGEMLDPRTGVYTIKNMKANTASIPIPATGPAQVTAMVAIAGAVPFRLNNPIQTVALVSRNVALPPIP